jgi:hypothetical protein
MKRGKQDHKLREWLRIHSVITGFILTALVVTAGVLSLLFVNRFSPTEFSFGPDATASLSVSAHDTAPNPNLLPNNLTDNTTPDYLNNVIMSIPRQSSGQIPELFRIEGQMTYK